MKKTSNSKKDSSEIVIEILPLLKELARKLWLIILVGLVMGGSVFLVSRVFVKPTYRSGFTAYVNNKQTKQATEVLSVSDVSAAKLLVQTYQKILLSNSILTASAESISLNLPYDDLKNMVSTEIMDDTEIISVYVVDTNPQLAYEYAEAISKTAPKYMSQTVEGSSMKIIDYAEYNPNKYKPSYLRFALIGFLAGAFLITLFLCIRFYMDDTVKTEGDLEDKYDIPILGTIPNVLEASGKNSGYYSDYSYYNTEQKDEGNNEE